MTTKAAETCYACDQPATTREHVPPFSFFPEGHKQNLITVPSCAAHNNANSKDVEYVRNIITTSFGVNSVGETIFSTKRCALMTAVQLCSTRPSPIFGLSLSRECSQVPLQQMSNESR